MIIGYHKEDFENYKIKVPVCITLEKKESNILITGKSGSGKSLSTRWYLWNMLHNKESVCYIADYKGGTEYETFEGTPAYATGEDAIKMIEDFYLFFTEVRKNRLRLTKHYSLFIEEWFGLLTYAETKNKKLKTELMSKVGEILSVARGLNLGIILCIQRADSSNFSSGARDQFQCVINFGRCSTEQFRMLGFSGELEDNPTNNFKPGQALALIDGQNGVQEILVPWIRNADVMCKQIRILLDKQSDIAAQIQAIAEGKSDNL